MILTKMIILAIYTLWKLRVNNNPLRIIVGQLNINCIKNKSDALCSIFKQKIDILLVSETKNDDTFPLAQFYVDLRVLTDLTEHVKEGVYCFM